MPDGTGGSIIAARIVLYTHDARLCRTQNTARTRIDGVRAEAMGSGRFLFSMVRLFAPNRCCQRCIRAGADAAGGRDRSAGHGILSKGMPKPPADTFHIFEISLDHSNGCRKVSGVAADGVC